MQFPTIRTTFQIEFQLVCFQAYIKESSLLSRQVIVQSNPMKNNIEQSKLVEANSENEGLWNGGGANVTGTKTMNNMPVEQLTSHMLSFSCRLRVIPTLLVSAMSFWIEAVLYQTNLTART